MLETQQFNFVDTDHPDLISNPNRLVRTAGVEWVPDDTSHKTVFFINKETWERTHQVLLTIDASCSSCTELRHSLGNHHCAPLRLDWKLRGSYRTVFLSDLDRTKAVCPLYLTWENPPFVNVAMRMLTVPRKVWQRTLRGLDILEQFPNAE